MQPSRVYRFGGEYTIRMPGMRHASGYQAAEGNEACGCVLDEQLRLP